MQTNELDKAFDRMRDGILNSIDAAYEPLITYYRNMFIFSCILVALWLVFCWLTWKPYVPKGYKRGREKVVLIDFDEQETVSRVYRSPSGRLCAVRSGEPSVFLNPDGTTGGPSYVKKWKLLKG